VGLVDIGIKSQQGGILCRTLYTKIGMNYYTEYCVKDITELHSFPSAHCCYTLSLLSAEIKNSAVDLFGLPSALPVQHCLLVICNLLSVL
jgi:hypothetical protein